MSISLSTDNIRGILLDVEGTTTPIDFVYGVLFPYVRAQVGEFLEVNAADPEVQQILQGLKLEHENETRGNLMTPAWHDHPIEYINWLMDQDRKMTALKALQGRIWLQGYQSGKLKGRVFPDVAANLRKWHDNNIDIRVFSSGSTLAQRLLFSSTADGNLSPWIKEHFDTNVGAKIDPASYTAIASAFQLKPKQILFISDVTRELDAARQAGMKTVLCMRPGNHPQVMHDHKAISSFEEILD